MAITIISNPQLYEPAYNRMTYVCTSTNSGNASFRMLADVYVAGSGSFVGRLRIAADTTSGSTYFIARVNEILEAFVTEDVGDPTSTVGTTANDNSITDYVVRFGEEYEVAGVLTQFPDLTIDSTRYAWNGSWTYEDEATLGYLTYMLTNDTRKFLTKAPATIKTMDDASGWLYFLHDTSPAIQVFHVETFNASGGLLGKWEIKNPLTFADTGERLGKVVAHPYSLNNIDNTELALGVQPIITDDTASYTIHAKQSTGTQLSEKKTFVIQDRCKYQRWNLIFINRNGGFDSFVFTLVNKLSDSITRTLYEKEPNRVTSLGNYPISQADRQKSVFFTRSVPRRLMNSNWLTEAESSWLEELMSTPIAWLEDENNNLIAVRVTNNSWQEEKRVNTKLFQAQVTVELATNYRQRG